MKKKIETHETHVNRDFGILRLFLTGFAMGSADIVPGVSGGTVALIFGVYEKLIESIKLVSGQVLKMLIKGDVKGAIKTVPWKFLMPLGLGLLSAVASLAKLIQWLMANQPVMLWSFFFGLVLASVFVVRKKVKLWSMANLLIVVVSAILAFMVVGMVPVETPQNLLAFFLSGAVAIMAMILPGVSGSFLLVVLGKYAQVLNAVTSKDFLTLGVFALGAVFGLALFSRVLSWLFEHHHDVAMSSLIGIMLGSLRKVWPWKEVVATRLNSHGELVPLIERNLLPATFDMEFFMALALCLIAFGLIWQLSKIDDEKS